METKLLILILHFLFAAAKNGKNNEKQRLLRPKHYICAGEINIKEMQVQFAKEALRELYDNGKTSDKSYRLQPQIVRKYQYCIDILLGAADIEALYVHNSLHYEVLKGDKKGISSIRVNNRYRIEFTVHEAEFKGRVVDTLANICNIIDLSNHYK